MPRFVVLEHDWPFLHWDFLLETGPTLRTWRLLGEPGPGRELAAEPIAAHRTEYLEYEGPVTGGRGTVRRWDRGTFDWVVNQEDRVEVVLAGTRLAGRCRLVGTRWLLGADDHMPDYGTAGPGRAVSDVSD